MGAPGSKDNQRVEIVDVRAESVLAIVVFKDGTVRFDTNQSMEWCAATLRGFADQIETNPHG